MNDDQYDDSRVHIKGRRRHALPTAEQRLLQQRARDRLEPTRCILIYGHASWFMCGQMGTSWNNPAQLSKTLQNDMAVPKRKCIKAHRSSCGGKHIKAHVRWITRPGNVNPRVRHGGPEGK